MVVGAPSEQKWGKEHPGSAKCRYKGDRGQGELKQTREKSVEVEYNRPTQEDTKRTSTDQLQCRGAPSRQHHDSWSTLLVEELTV